MRSKLSVDLDLALYAHQDRIVHNVAAGQELRVLFDCFIDPIDVLRAHVDLLHVMLVRDKVLVFQS